MRRRIPTASPRPVPLRLATLALLVLLPTATYEAVQKSTEWMGMHGRLPRLSQRAEDETRWRPVTGIWPVDHTLHEMAETRRFYRLTGRYLKRKLVV